MPYRGSTGLRSPGPASRSWPTEDCCFSNPLCPPSSQPTALHPALLPGPGDPSCLSLPGRVLCLLPPTPRGNLEGGLVGVSDISQKPVCSAPRSSEPRCPWHGSICYTCGVRRKLVRSAVLAELGGSRQPTSAGWRAELAPLISPSRCCGPGHRRAAGDSWVCIAREQWCVFPEIGTIAKLWVSLDPRAGVGVGCTISSRCPLSGRSL